jgi:predicted small metal-binding protein
MKELRCGDLMDGCPAVFEGETIDDIIKQAAKHAHEEHGIADITPEVQQAVLAAIRDK